MFLRASTEADKRYSLHEWIQKTLQETASLAF